MRSISKEELTDMLRFVERQTSFVLRTTETVQTYRDFLTSDSAMVLFNSTCMCVQTLGETIKKIDDYTGRSFLVLYPEIPWKQVIGMRNVISHEYLSVDPELVFSIVKDELQPLLEEVRRMLADVEAGRRDKELNSILL